MKIARSLSVGLALSCLVLSGLPNLARAQDPEDLEEKYGEFFDNVAVPEGMTKEDIQDVLALTLANRGWVVKQKTDRRVVGYLKHRGYEATVTLLFAGGDTIAIYCDGWALDRRGEQAKPKQPSGWLGNLKKDLTKRFSVAAATR